jgi:hypothetical protein
MSTLFIRGIVTACAGALVLTGCAQPIGGADGDGVDIRHPDPPAAISAAGEVLGQGTVLQVEGEPVNLCLGAVMESYPPQCSGPEVVGWEWAAVDGKESASGVTWGTYAVQGTWDGMRLTVTQPPIMLALYDPMMTPPDPKRDPANQGKTAEAALLSIQEEVHELAAVEVLTSSAENGYLFLGVVYDDGQLQRYFDALYGPDVIAVESALRPVAP